MKLQVLVRNVMQQDKPMTTTTIQNVKTLLLWSEPCQCLKNDHKKRTSAFILLLLLSRILIEFHYFYSRFVVVRRVRFYICWRYRELAVRLIDALLSRTGLTGVDNTISLSTLGVRPVWDGALIGRPLSFRLAIRSTSGIDDIEDDCSFNHSVANW